MQMTWKHITLKNLKLDESGVFHALFAPFNVVDKQGDLTLPGAFGEQRVIVSAYGHGSWREGLSSLPVGKGRIFEQPEGGIVEGQFFLDTLAGAETYKTVKNLGDLQEWSYALPAIEYEMRTQEGQTVRVLKKITVNEVSPVLMGAGIGTRTLDIKKACPVHSTPTDTTAWDGPANEAKLPSGKDLAFYRKAYAWQDPDGDPAVKSSYKFIHHFVDGEGNPGPASTRACSAGIAVLNGGRGGANIPDADREGVWRHLARHLRDAEMEPPELRSQDATPKSMKVLDHLDLVVVDAEAVIERLKDIAELSDARGAHPAEATMKRALHVKTVLQDLVVEIDRVARKHNPLTAEILRYEEIISTGRRT